MQGVMAGTAESVVPCDGCTACCTSSQFVAVAPDETDTLAHIPAGLLFPAPRRPAGHVLLGYDERGHCPMLVENRCSIYEHRPRTCRSYDCRVLSAAGLDLDDADKGAIADRVRQWRFSVPSSSDAAKRQAVMDAATFLDDHRELFPDGTGPAGVTALALEAIEIHARFLARDAETEETVVVRPHPEVVRHDLHHRTRQPS
jgi:hypothetical protein